MYRKNDISYRERTAKTKSFFLGSSQDGLAGVGEEREELEPFIRTLQELSLSLGDPDRDLRLVEVCDLLIPGQELRELQEDRVRGIAFAGEVIHGGLHMGEAVGFTGREESSDRLPR